MSSTADPLPLILFSGLAADASVFAPQKLAFPQLVVPRWLKPERRETLTSYCERVAAEIRPNTRCVLGGASFGGIIALEMAQYLNPLAVVLIGSVRGPSELPRRVCFWRPFRSLVPLAPVTPFQWSAGKVSLLQQWWPHFAGVARQFSQADADVFRWSVRQLLAWQNAPVVDCPVFQIHGQFDRVLPARLTRPDVVVPGGHVISLTHSQAVNEFLRHSLQQVARADG
ncbi:Alpha/beta hydrolase family protein [Anatilimnocola aggregata]|uniref:Alpha/beta hydrolase family protein n=1 Tax=Anatilimnocola aggregata TaxID=2528021 RepID=A0A517YLP4_9BACT|nr:alpha/beta hydrolase [Anatilimnocola aggregata]QDU31134.1 Alpha/beta hydrolase family protein [Anatilimnocola aggregata]